MTRRTRTPESLWRTINKSTVQQGDHLIWTGTTSQGYTKIAHHINDNGTTISRSAVRVIWELSVGPLPSEHWLRRKPTCDEPLCVNPAHYQPHDTTAPKPAPERKTPPTLAERIERRTQSGDDGCIIWTGRIDSDGYPTVTDGKTESGWARLVPVHRAYWEQINGLIPEGYELARMNGCENRRCINPDHLTLNEYKGKAGRIAQNQNISLTHYRCGHEKTPENSYFHSGGAACKTCTKAKSRERCRRWRSRHPDKVKAYREKQLKQLTPEQEAEFIARKQARKTSSLLAA